MASANREHCSEKSSQSGSGTLVGGVSVSWCCGAGDCGSTGLGGRGGWEGMSWVPSSDLSSVRGFCRFSRLAWCSRAGEDWWTGGVAGGENTGDFGGRLGRQVRRRYLIMASICLSGFGQIIVWLCSGMGGAMSGDGVLDGGVVMRGVVSGLDAGDRRSGVFGGKARHWRMSSCVVGEVGLRLCLGKVRHVRGGDRFRASFSMSSVLGVRGISVAGVLVGDLGA